MQPGHGPKPHLCLAGANFCCLTLETASTKLVPGPQCASGTPATYSPEVYPCGKSAPWPRHMSLETVSLPALPVATTPLVFQQCFCSGIAGLELIHCGLVWNAEGSTSSAANWSVEECFSISEAHPLLPGNQVDRFGLGIHFLTGRGAISSLWVFRQDRFVSSSVYTGGMDFSSVLCLGCFEAGGVRGRNILCFGCHQFGCLDFCM